MELLGEQQVTTLDFSVNLQTDGKWVEVSFEKVTLLPAYIRTEQYGQVYVTFHFNGVPIPLIVDVFATSPAETLYDARNLFFYLPLVREPISLLSIIEKAHVLAWQKHREDLRHIRHSIILGNTLFEIIDTENERKLHEIECFERVL